jgi:hypothetical protein
MAVQRVGGSSLAIVLPVAGLLSGLTTAGLAYPCRQVGVYGIGSVFGVIMGIALAKTKILQGAWKAILFIVPAAAAYYLAYAAAGVAELCLALVKFPGTQSPSPTPSPVALFVGGTVGGFTILAVFSMLAIYPGVDIGTLALNSLSWSPVGGVLGVIGWELGPFLGMLVWSGAHSIGLTDPTETYQNALLSDKCHLFSLWAVWQTGIALVLAILLQRASPLKATRAADARWGTIIPKP